MLAINSIIIISRHPRGFEWRERSGGSSSVWNTCAGHCCVAVWKTGCTTSASVREKGGTGGGGRDRGKRKGAGEGVRQREE